MMESQLRSLSMQLTSMATQTEITSALKAAASTMGKVNDKMDIKDIQKVMQDFAKTSESMGIKMAWYRKRYNQHQMGDAMEGVSEDVEGEAEETYEQVLGEIGLEMVEGQAVPSSKIQGKTVVKADVSGLEKKLKELKG